MLTLPSNFTNRMKRLLNDEFEDFIKALEQPPVKAYRINTEKISVDDFEKINPFGNEKIPYVNSGFYLDYDKIGNHPYHHAGMIYVQEPAAMASVEAVEIDKNWNVLDMCAAPGGKSTQIKNKLSENSVLVSNEIIMNRCKILTGNIERLGLNNCVTTCMDTKKLADIFPNTFDMIIVDAPCSGEGMFRKEQFAIDCWSEENIRICARRQTEILNNAVSCLRNGGYIIYSTCTYSLEENEMVVDDFLNKYKNFELIPVQKELQPFGDDGIVYEGCKNESITLCKRFYPHKNRGEGQFVAVLHNTEPPEVYYNVKSNLISAERVVFDFLDDVLDDYCKDNVLMYADKPVYFTPNFKIEKGTAFSCGVTIGEIKKNYILPHHQFFMAMGKNFKRKINLDVNSRELSMFLHGEAFKTNAPDGWTVVCVNGCSVGGVKVSAGIAKNHYPKGLRTL